MVLLYLAIVQNLMIIYSPVHLFFLIKKYIRATKVVVHLSKLSIFFEREKSIT